MVQKALVLNTLKNNTAELSIRRRSACGGNCAGCEGCSLTENVIRVTAENKVGATSGQTVLVETKTRLIFRYAVLVYILPVFFLILGYMTAYMMSFSESICILTGFCSLLAGTALVLILHRIKKNDPVSYSITKVLEEQ